MLDLYGKAVDFIDSGRCFVMAAILDTDGSTPQVTGARALIEDAGKTWGTLGGGIVEAEGQRRAGEACHSKRPAVLDVKLKHAYSRGAAAICGGQLRILIDPLPAKHREAYAKASEARRARKRGILLTTVREDADVGISVQWLPESELSARTSFPGAEDIQACLAREASQVFAPEPNESGSRVTVLVEPVIPSPTLLIAGGGHIGQALTRVALMLDFGVTVIDDRPEFTNPELFPSETVTQCGDIAAEIAATAIEKDTYVVIVTRGHKQDAEALEACIHSPAAYIGMIGSRQKIAMIRKNFMDSGLATEAEWNRVFAPIGLDIGAVTVPEIATSIAAELVAVRRKGAAQLPRRPV